MLIVEAEMFQKNFQKSKEDLVFAIADAMPDADDDEIARACLAAGIWSDAEVVALGAKKLEFKVMEVMLEMESEGRIEIGDGGIVRRVRKGGANPEG